MKAKRIRFVINPFSGAGRKGQLPGILTTYFKDSLHQWELKETHRPGHGTELAREAAAQNYDMVVAIGGDGSVNEVMCGLVETKTPLGIIPAGSGNGFGRHIGMSLDPVIAIQQLMHGTEIDIDACTLNSRPFVNLAGIGFDAQVATRLRSSTFRGFWAYLQFSLEEAIKYQARHYEIKMDDREIEGDYLMIEVANAPMFGYNFEIASQAKYNDGWLEVVLVKNVPKWRIVLGSWRLLTKSFHLADFVETYRAKTVKVTSRERMPVHVDGEGYHLSGTLDFKILPNALKLIIP